MTLTERQKDILEKAVLEYIERAEPISSRWLGTKYHISLSPATIRSELQDLCEDGYLEQPYSSSGRVPTDQGYRFFVDAAKPGKISFQPLSKFSALVLVYHRNTLWKEGWERVLLEPEFARQDLLVNFTKFLLDMEENIELVRCGENLRIYIGKENVFSTIEDFSMIIRECKFERGEKSFVAIVGPKRMPYHKNIGFLPRFIRLWKWRLKR